MDSVEAAKVPTKPMDNILPLASNYRSLNKFGIKILIQGLELGFFVFLVFVSDIPIMPRNRIRRSSSCPANIVLVPQGAECGEGLQRRNLSCVVRWGGQRPDSSPQPVGAELCGDQLVRSIQQEMERPCFVPCPGEGAAETPVGSLIDQVVLQ